MKWIRLEVMTVLLAILVYGLQAETLVAAEKPKPAPAKSAQGTADAKEKSETKSDRKKDEDPDLRNGDEEEDEKDLKNRKKKPSRKRTTKKRPGRMPVGVGRSMPARPATGNRPQGNFGGNDSGIGGNDSSPAAKPDASEDTTDKTGGARAAEDAAAGTGKPAAEGPPTGRGMQGTPPPRSLNAGYGPKKKGPPDPKVVTKVMRIQERHTERLLSQVGVAGTGTGIDGEGNVVVKVYTTGEGNPRIPETLEGVPVVRSMMGPFYTKGLPKFNPRQRADRPVPIGVSCFGYSPKLCATGTLGCRVKSGDGSLFILSNNHVLALENAAQKGVTVAIQPGTLDEAFPCIPDPSAGVGLLYDFVTIAFKGVENHVDAAIATTAAEYVTTSTPYGGYGVPTSTVATAFLGQRVQKYGRTTGYTVGTVTDTNMTLSLYYGKNLAKFVGQIAVTADSGPMSLQGDSGSLVVDMNRNPVGLLFAGSAGGGTTIINPIQIVLDSFSVEVDSSPRSSSGKHGHWVP